MSLRIHIQQRKAAYAAGDIVSGTVTLVGSEDVGVRSISVNLTRYSASAERRLSRGLQSKGDITESWEDETIIGDIKFEEKSPPASERMDLRDHVDLKLRPQHWIYPTFSTFNLNIRYQMRIEIQVECARENYDTYFQSNSLEVLSEKWVGPHQGQSAANMGFANEVFDPVPTYQPEQDFSTGYSGGAK